MMDVNRINKTIENLVNEVAMYHLPGDVINLSYSAGDVKIIIK